MKKILSKDLPIKMQKIRNLSFQLLDIVNLTFNQSWFFVVSENCPLNIYELHTLLDGLERDAYFYPDLNRLEESCRILDDLCSYSRRYLLPCLREKLGVSCFTTHKPDKKCDKFIQASFIAYAFPVNLQKISALLKKMQQELLLGVTPVSGTSS